MHDPIVYAIPAFIVFLVIEVLALHVWAHDDHHDDGPVGYEARDTATSLSMGLGYLAINFGWRFVSLLVYAVAYELTPLKLSPSAWYAWVILFFADDLAYYCFHRTSHRVRVFWAGHVVHHSSRYFNFSTALRQKWTPMLSLPFWLPLALIGIPPWMIFVAQSWSLFFQFFLHTEKIRKLPRPVEAVLNTPSHHRVHHGADQEYLDRNYAGILIVWDRLFGTYTPETRRPRYGLTKNITTFHPVKVAFHEFADVMRDVRTAPTWRLKLGYLFGPPGWQPTDEPEPAAEPAAGEALAEPARV